MVGALGGSICTAETDEPPSAQTTTVLRIKTQTVPFEPHEFWGSPPFLKGRLGVTAVAARGYGLFLTFHEQVGLTWW